MLNYILNNFPFDVKFVGRFESVIIIKSRQKYKKSSCLMWFANIKFFEKIQDVSYSHSYYAYDRYVRVV